jgi:hypothetical protein
MTKRMRIFAQGLLYQCKKFKLKAECIFVEWNPIPEKPLLKDILPLPKPDDYLTIRFIQVPNSLHKQLKHSDKLPLFQMIAKNVGIRRSNAPMVICTNVDLLFSDNLFSELSSINTDRGTFFRCNRCDIPNHIREDISVEEQLNFSKNNILQRLGKNNKYAELEDTRGLIYKIPGVLELFGFFLRVKTKLFGKTIDDELSILDTDACGDFTLMHKEDWIKIEGYYELEAYSLHIDSIAIYMAYASGLKQSILNWKSCTYHIRHDNGWELMDPVKKIYFDIEKPMLDWSTVSQLAYKMIEKKKAILINQPTWGMSDKQLKEYIFEPGMEMREIN